MWYNAYLAYFVILKLTKKLIFTLNLKSLRYTFSLKVFSLFT